MKKLSLAFLVTASVFTACKQGEEKEIIPFIEGVPTIDSVTDSLTKTNAISAKWAVSNDEILYAVDQEIDWKREFEIFRKSNVNQLRYKDAYTVSDKTVGETRTIAFTAKDKAQEIQLMEVRLKKEQIIYYEIQKSRDNVISSANHKFVLDQNTYSFNINQQIEAVFDNQQYVQGNIIPHGNLWLGQFPLGEKMMPLQFVLDLENKRFHVKNGSELIGFNDYKMFGDTLQFSSDFFDSHFLIHLTSDSTLFGKWINEKREDVRSYEFTAQKDIAYRFEARKLTTQNLTGKHTMYFYNQDGSIEDSTILKLNQNYHEVTGSVLTETGDYRFLEGVVRNDSLLLSTMDGTHAYLFEAAINGNELTGNFYAGCCYQQSWSAKLGKTFEMRDPSNITQLKEGAEVDFAFPDANGNMLSLNDEQFEGHPVILTLMGTWCSNCLDEAMFLKEAQDLYANNGLKIIGLDFELINDSARAFTNIKRHQESLDINYPVLLACLGSTKDKAAAQVPFLNGIYSYPTMIVLDKNHEVVKIHTGFNGPATGEELYEVFRKEYLELFGELVK